LVWLLATAAALAVASVYYAQPMLDLIADEFGISRATAGAIISMTQIGYGFGLVLLVPLGDLLNRRTLIIRHFLLAAIALMCTAFASSKTMLLLTMVATGLFAVVTQLLVAHASALAGQLERGRVVGAVTSGVVSGILLARTVAGGLCDLFGWRSVYFTASIASLFIILFLVRALPSHEPSRVGLTYPKLVVSMYHLFTEHSVLRVRGLLGLLIFSTITTLLTPMALELASAPYSLTYTQIGLFGLAGAAGALSASAAGRSADRGHAQATTAIALLIMLGSWVLIYLTPYSLGYLVAGVVLMDFGLQAVHVTNQSLIYQVQPDAQSRLAALYMVFYSIGCATGATSATLVYDRTGWNGVCVLGAGLSTSALLLWAFTRHVHELQRNMRYT
jgi:predicted MFS family arabinose efflux permease